MTIKRLTKQRNFLLSYNKFSPAQKKLIKANLTPDIIKVITEICVNIESGVIPIKKSKLSKAVRLNIKNLSKLNLSLNKRKDIIQKGGFIASLLSASLPYLIDLLAEQLMKK